MRERRDRPDRGISCAGAAALGASEFPANANGGGAATAAAASQRDPDHEQPAPEHIASGSNQPSSAGAAPPARLNLAQVAGGVLAGQK